MTRLSLVKHLAALTALSASLFILDQTSFFVRASGMFGSSIIEPTISRSRSSLHLATDSLASIFSVRTFPRRLSSLETERDYFRGEYLRLQSVEEENELLRQALQLEDTSQKLLLSKLVNINSLLPLERIEIDKGLTSGVQLGDAVVTENRVLIGTIINVKENNSTVQLVTSESSNIPALLSSSGTHASLRGSATGVLNVDLIPREVQVNNGELVITSGVSGAVPSHLLVGDVQRVVDNETASFKRAIVRPLADITELKHVFVITSF